MTLEGPADNAVSPKPLDLEVSPCYVLTHRHAGYKAVTYVVQSQDRQSSEKLSPATRANLHVTQGSNSLTKHKKGVPGPTQSILTPPFAVPSCPFTSLPLPDSLLKQRQAPPLFVLVTEVAAWEVGVLFKGEAG